MSSDLVSWQWFLEQAGGTLGSQSGFAEFLGTPASPGQQLARDSRSRLCLYSLVKREMFCVFLLKHQASRRCLPSPSDFPERKHVSVGPWNSWTWGSATLGTKYSPSRQGQDPCVSGRTVQVWILTHLAEGPQSCHVCKNKTAWERRQHQAGTHDVLLPAGLLADASPSPAWHSRLGILWEPRMG